MGTVACAIRDRPSRSRSFSVRLHRPPSDEHYRSASRKGASPILCYRICATLLGSIGVCDECERAGTSADHEMGVFGEVTKFLWFLCDSIREEPDACYIMVTEFAAVVVPMIMIIEPDWALKKAQVPSLCTILFFFASAAQLCYFHHTLFVLRRT